MSGSFNDTDFIFDLNQKVELIDSGECGHVVGRAQFLSSDNQYLIRYAAADGRQVQEWWDEVAVQPHTEWNAEDVPRLTEVQPAWRQGAVNGLQEEAMQDQKQEPALEDVASPNIVIL